MKLYMKQKIFSWADTFGIFDGEKNRRYTVKGEIIALGKKLHLYDEQGNELAYVKEKIVSLLPEYIIYIRGQKTAKIVKDITLFRPKYTVKELDWKVKGDILDHEYEIRRKKEVIAAVSKKWFAIGDTYEIDINDSADELTVLATVLAIDACIEKEREKAEKERKDD